jgi:hypothetical protein
MKTILLVAAVLLVGLDLGTAHEVAWFESYYSGSSTNPMVFTTVDPRYSDHYIEVYPSAYEPCIVQVNLDPQTSPYIEAHVVGPNPANWVEIEVSPVGVPLSPNVITATVSGEWHATGSPLGFGCDATNANHFSVPVKIALSRAQWGLNLSMDRQNLWINTRSGVALQASDSLSGPCVNIGTGVSFWVPPDREAQFFSGTTRLGGGLAGGVTDNAGNPQTNVTVGLPYGGAMVTTATTAGDGSFLLDLLPWGTNLITILKSFTFVDPGTGSNRTETAAVEILAPATNSQAVVQLVAVPQVWPPPPACNCSPWCAIGFGTFNGARTPVYFSAGANPPKGVPPTCAQPQVTVTPPGGAPFPIMPGTGRHQNSGPNPASGVWTVSVTVCGQTKMCTVTVP